jgi:hypothetical protein
MAHSGPAAYKDTGGQLGPDVSLYPMTYGEEKQTPCCNPGGPKEWRQQVVSVAGLPIVPRDETLPIWPRRHLLFRPS